MKKFVCSICGFVHEGEYPPGRCPGCGAGGNSKLMNNPGPTSM